MFPPFEEAPYPITVQMPGGTETADMRTQVCLKADAAALMALIEPIVTAKGAPFAGKTLKLVQLYGNDQMPAGTEGTAEIVWIPTNPAEQRRNWIIQTADGLTVCGCCEEYLEVQNAHGVGAPGSWQYVPLLGANLAGFKSLTWVPDTSVSLSAAPATSLAVAQQQLDYWENQVLLLTKQTT